ncbi:MAG: hypothetical protein C0621_09595 [Desulfuromonas sp.]|nr:MAG: hypothetical protein C0621_09595 [Desulfuromonas sp.]
MDIIKRESCSSISERSVLTYEIGRDESNHLHIRISDNSGNGHICDHWIAMGAVLEIIENRNVAFTGRDLHPLFKGKSVNTAHFLLAALKNEGVAKPEKRRHICGDIKRFMKTLRQAEVICSQGSQKQADQPLTSQGA